MKQQTKFDLFLTLHKTNIVVTEGEGLLPCGPDEIGFYAKSVNPNRIMLHTKFHEYIFNYKQGIPFYIFFMRLTLDSLLCLAISIYSISN